MFFTHKKIISRTATILLALTLLPSIGTSPAFGEVPIVNVTGLPIAGQSRWIATWNSPQAAIDGESRIAPFLKRHMGGRHSLLTGTEQEIRTRLQSILMTPGTSVTLEPDIDMHPAAVTPNDALWASQWSLQDSNTSTYGIGLPTARSYFSGEPGAGVRVAIVDTGITNHSDLPVTPVNWSNNGWDFFADNLDPTDTGDACAKNGSSSSWHGTHVAGTIAAQTNNNKGVAGIAPAANLIIARTLGPCGGSLVDVADAIRWSAGLPVTGRLVNPPTLTNPAKVINLSLGGVGTCDSYIQSAITDARNAGALIVVAAGNNNQKITNFVPANCAGVVSVAAVGQTGQRAWYSNFGTETNTVTIAAPGGDSTVNAPNSQGMIISTLNSGTTIPVAENYVGYQGTSMATPHVVGVAALLIAANPNLNPASLTTLITASAKPFPASAAINSCSTGICGAGIVNAASALALLATSYRSQPSNVTPPSVTGIVKAGETLTASIGAWSGFPSPNFSLAWLECGSQLDAQLDSCTPLSGETNSSLQVKRTSVGKFLRLRVVATLESYTPITVYSNSTSVVLNNLATSYSLTGPTTSTRGSTVQYTVSPNGYFIGTVTLQSSGVGADTSTVLTFTDSVTPQVASFTSATTGTLNVVAINSGGLIDPPTITTSITERIATSYTVSGPTQGVIGATSLAFTIVPNGLVTGFIRVTPSGGGLSTMIEKSYSLSGRSETFTVTPTAASDVTLSFSNTAGLANPTPISYRVINSTASTYSLMGPNEMYVGQLSDTFTVTPDSVFTGTITLTPSGGGLSTPIPLSYVGTFAPQYFHLTPTETGTVSFNASNSQTLLDPITLPTPTVYLGKVQAPNLLSPISFAESFTAILNNYDASLVYETSTSRGLVTLQPIDTTTALVVVAGLLPSETATVNLLASKLYWKSSETSFTGAALIGAPSIPQFDQASVKNDGYSVNIVNFDSQFDYTIRVSSGVIETATVDTFTVSILVKGLTPGSSSTLVVSTSRNGFADGSNSVTAFAAEGPALIPTFSPVTRQPNGFALTVNNFDPLFSFSASTNSGVAVFDTQTALITVRGLGAGESATVTLRVTRSGFAGSTTTISGSAQDAISPPPPPPPLPPSPPPAPFIPAPPPVVLPAPIEPTPDPVVVPAPVEPTPVPIVVPVPVQPTPPPIVAPVATISLATIKKPAGATGALLTTQLSANGVLLRTIKSSTGIIYRLNPQIKGLVRIEVTSAQGIRSTIRTAAIKKGAVVSLPPLYFFTAGSYSVAVMTSKTTFRSSLKVIK